MAAYSAFLAGVGLYVVSCEMCLSSWALWGRGVFAFVGLWWRTWGTCRWYWWRRGYAYSADAAPCSADPRARWVGVGIGAGW